MTKKERVTVDLDAECYYLDGDYWESWDHYGEEMADTINKLLNEQDTEIKRLKTIREEQIETILKQKRKIKELEKENKQLKEQLQNIQVLFDNEISRNEETIEWGKHTGANVGAITFHNEMLKKMKKVIWNES